MERRDGWMMPMLFLKWLIPLLLAAVGGRMARRGAVEALDRLGARRCRDCGAPAEMGVDFACTGRGVRLGAASSAQTICC